VLELETYLAHLTGLASQITTPGGASLWREIREFFPTPFVSSLEKRVAAGDLPDSLSNPYFRVDEPTRPAAQQSAAADLA
jgi:hypothetical protein